MSVNVLIPTVENGKIAYPATQETGETTRNFLLRATREALDYIEGAELTIDHTEKIEIEET